ncbi:hypothetical protein BXZ70DRAFT_1008940 [Cristinia sonorae]|uniref:Anaphase-promoting complex subunit 15 n=1 Tax=Cristinia sonorae TaxID=1940300 RepID=A0A8K0ULH9_9AGAR|nr:hypothetical protein BXZ70DRAFT_1008940 [Cristinia sonorae]
MAFAFPTILPPSPNFPRLLPQPPLRHPTPLPPYHSTPSGMKYRRNLIREMDDLSEEETELVELNDDIRQRGAGFLVPIGRALTQTEEKNDADEASDDDADDDDDDESNGDDDEGDDDDDEEEAEQDLDADMDDMDEEGGGNTTNGDADEMDEEGEVSREAPSSDI